MNNNLDKTTLELIRNAIDAGWVSVFYDPSGQIKEYTTLMLENIQLSAEKCLAANNGTAQYYDYTITIGNTIVVDTTIANNKQFYTQQEQDILNIYNQMSKKVIFQEMTATKTNTYNA